MNRFVLTLQEEEEEDLNDGEVDDEDEEGKLNDCQFLFNQSATE